MQSLVLFERTQTPDTPLPDTRSSDTPSPDTRSPETRSRGVRSSDTQRPDARSPDRRRPDARSHSARSTERGGDVELDAAGRRLVEEHLDLARRLAYRYAGRGEPIDELTQVAMLGLVKAAGRFDPERGTTFATFAVPTVLGELRRYFRDSCWALRVPRRLHDLYQAGLAAQEELTGRLGRTPRPSELAEHLGVEEKDVLDALESSSAYSALSLEAYAPNAGEDADALESIVGEDDRRLERVEQRESVRGELTRLPERERYILVQYYFRGQTQSRIGADLGVSQMHVSRLLNATLERIRRVVRRP